MRRAVLLAALLGLSGSLEAQNSGYGILGIGFPTRPSGVRTRALGDGTAAIDPQSAINPAALGLASALSVAVGAAQEYRTLTLAGVETSGLHQARFPYLMMNGRFGRTRLAYSVGYFAYVERTFELSSTDTVMLRGAPVVVTDRIGSAGAVVDSRGALTWSFNSRWSAGIGVHILGGSARLSARRIFSDSTYRPYVEISDANFGGLGWSAGVMATPSPAFRAGIAGRVDSKLTRSVNGASLGDVSLPVSVNGGVEARLAPLVRLAVGAAWRSWSAAAKDLPTGTQAFDTWEAGAGLELGGGTAARPKPPVRLGIRYATLPFSPDADQPHELNLTAGSRVRFARNRVQVELAVERAMRDGGNARERAWQFNLGFELIP